MKSVSAHSQMSVIIPRLREWITSADLSMRGLCSLTDSLEPPEKLAHGNLSPVLLQKPGKNLYFQQFLVLCNCLKISPASLFVGTDDRALAQEAADVARAYCKLSEEKRRQVAKILGSS